MPAQNRRWQRFGIATLGGALVSASLAASPPASAADGPYDPYFAAPQVVADMGASARPFGLAAGDFDSDGIPDMVIGRTTGNIAFAKGNGDGTFATPAPFSWKQAYYNAWSMTPAYVDEDANLDLIWGATADIGQVHDGDVRAFLGNGDGTFDLDADVVSGVTYNAGVLLGDIGSDASSLAAADIDNDGDVDVVASGTDGVKLIRKTDDGSYSVSAVSTAGTSFPAAGTVDRDQNRSWGLAFGDAEGDGDQDLWIGDRALYVYLYKNDGTGAFTMTPGNLPGLATRPNVYLRHDSFRPAVGYTPSLATADVNGDDKADLFVGLLSGGQNPTCTTCAHDGEILVDVSDGDGYTVLGPLGDIGTMARGLQTADVDGDGATDLLGASYEGQVSLLRQLPPLDDDEDGISDYIDNALGEANAPRIDMNGDGTINAADQLDNDFDTVLGIPQDNSTWTRLGDPADPDDDNDGVSDSADNCAFAANAGQADADGDGVGDKCDPLFDSDADGDGVPAMDPSDPLYDRAKDAAAKWAEGDTHFVIRIDALGRLFQNEFTQLLTDAAILTPAEFEAKCWENYRDGENDPVEQCGTGEGTPDQSLTLDGGRNVPVSLVTIPKMLWTDAPVIDWINDRNDSSNLDLAMHATYHTSNTMLGDWAGDSNKNFYSCEPCGLSLAENYELLKVGKDTLLGNYGNKWVADSGATSSSPKIDWNSSANPLLSYAPPFNTDDTLGREAVALLGFRAHSSSVYEENSLIFSPEGPHEDTFDQFGLFHAAADVELDPPDTESGPYDPVAYKAFLEENTHKGQLNTWLIEEVEWSGRPCNDQPRVGPNFENVSPDCPEAGGATTNRENNTVYGPRWDAWLQLLDYVKHYDGGVVMTLADVALAKSFDNAPTVANPDQADSDHNGIGDVVDGATLTADDATLSRNTTGNLTATLANGGEGLDGQAVTFTFDRDGDGADETYVATTDADGKAVVSVTPTRRVGDELTFGVSWTDGGTSATDTGTVTIGDVTSLELDASNPPSGQVTDPVEVSATVLDSDEKPVAGKSVEFAIGGASATGTTDASGVATATLTLTGPAQVTDLTATFAGADLYGPSSDSTDFTVEKEDTTLVLGDLVKVKSTTTAPVTLREADGDGLANQTVDIFAETRKGRQTSTTLIATVTTGPDGTATVTVPAKYRDATLSATFAGDDSFLGSSD